MREISEGNPRTQNRKGDDPMTTKSTITATQSFGGNEPMTRANSHAEITGLQRESIRCAARRVGATEQEMAGFFLAGGDWDAAPGAELEELLVEYWQESIFENQ